MRIITNADDLGSSLAVNRATFQLMSEGLVTSATVLANGPQIADACSQATRFPRCSFGVHLNLTEFRPLSHSAVPSRLLGDDGCFNGKLRQVPRLDRYRNFIFDEFCAQVDLLKGRGLNVSHLDSHHHVHTIPAVLPVLKAVQKKYGIRRVRISLNVYSLAKPAGRWLLAKKALFNAVLRHWYRTRTTDAFTDIDTFTQRREEVTKKYRVIEIMLHPGGPASELEARMLRALPATDSQFRARLISYAEL